MDTTQLTLDANSKMNASRYSGITYSRSINLTMTDLRQSTYDLWPNEFKQSNLALENIIIRENNESTYCELREAVTIALSNSREFQNSKVSEFIIRDPDRRLIDATNVHLLNNDGFIIIEDAGQKTLPVIYKHTYNTVPHTRSVTDQEGKFYGTDEHNLAGLALAELVDNSLSATAHLVDNERKIEIVFCDGDNPTLHVLDNGCGMDTNALKSGLKYKFPKEERPTTEEITVKTECDTENEIYPIYVNSKISKFGAGLKHAAFFLGRELRIMTKRENLNEVYEVHCSSESMKKREKQGHQDPWEVDQSNRAAGDLSLNTKDFPPFLIKRLEKQEKSKKSFTHISILHFDKDTKNVDTVLGLLRRLDGTSIEKQLKHLYFYYLYGHGGITPQLEKKSKVNLSVTRILSNGVKLSTISLADVKENYLDLESKFHNTATEDPYLFTIEVSAISIKSKEKPFYVSGIIRYHPFMYDRETLPLGTTHRRTIESRDPPASGSNAQGGDEEGPSMFERSTELFHIWWNGRLIPHTRLESFYWCSPSNNNTKANDKLYKSFGRISGSLFFDSHVSGVTDNKLSLTTTTDILKMFKEKTIGLKASVERVIVTADGSLRQQRMKDGNAKTNFVEWLKKSQKFDKEVIYSFVMLTPDNRYRKRKHNNKVHYYYQSAKWEIERSVDDIVRLNLPGQLSVLGKITGFMVNRETFESNDDPDQETLVAPLSLVEIQLRPVHLYGNGATIIKEMRFVDKTLDPDAGELLVKKKIEELSTLKLYHEWLGVPLESGASISIESVLITNLKIDIINHNGDSINAHFPILTLDNKSNRKQIQMITRIYIIHDDGTYELCYTGCICQYVKDGFYFRKTSLRNIEYINRPGNYVIKFYSFVQQEEGKDQSTIALKANAHIQSHSSDRAKHSRRASLRNTKGRDTKISPSTSLLIEANIEENNSRITSNELDWAPHIMDLDKIIGKKILSDNGEHPIRLPSHEIFFSVHPVNPDSVEIEQFGDIDVLLRVGEPFNMVLGFKDVKSNPTSNLEKILEKIPIISMIKNSKKSLHKIKLEFEYRTMKLSSDGKLIIEDVVARGSLCGREKKEIKVEVLFPEDPPENEMKSSILKTFYVGLPHKLEVCPKPIKIENGTMPRIACRVLDVCENTITFLEDHKRISLSCKIGKIDENGDYQFRLLDVHLLAADSEDQPQLLNHRLEYDELKSGTLDQIQIKCQLYCDAFPQIIPAEFPITIVPSTRAQKLHVYHTRDNGMGMDEIQSETLERKVGTQLKIFFKIFDGMGNALDFDPEEHTLEVNKEKVTDGEFTIKIPYKAEVKKFQSKLKFRGCSKDQNLTHLFQLVSKPLEPHRIIVSFCTPERQGGEILVPIDRLLPNILVKLLDPYDNIITEIKEEELRPNVDVMLGHGKYLCDYKCERDNGNPTGGSFLIKGEGDGFLGSALGLGLKTLTVKYHLLRDNLSFRVIPGLPCALIFDINGELNKNSSICVFPNQTRIKVRVMLVDKFKNPSPLQTTSNGEMIKVQLSVQKRDGEGKFKIQGLEQHRLLKNNDVADFGLMMVEVDSDSFNSSILSQSSLVCESNHGVPEKCFGNVIKMTAQTTLLGKPIDAICQFHLLCRPDTAFKILPTYINNEDEEHGFCYEAGSSFTNFTVTVKAEDGSDFMEARLNALNLAIRSEENYSADPITLSAKSVSEGVYVFGKGPTAAGSYAVDISYTDDTKNTRITLRMDEKLEILPSAVASLEPEQPLPQNITASNDEERSNRVITEDLTLVLKDVYGNICTAINGVLRITTNIPLEPCQAMLKEYPLRNGKVEIPELVLNREITLKNKTEYEIPFYAEVKEKRFSYSLKFTFLDNVQQQLEIRQLNEEKEQLETQINKAKTLLAESTSKREKLKRSYELSFRVEEETRRRLLLDNNFHIPTPNGLKSIEDVMEFEMILQTKEGDEIEKRSTSGAVSNIPEGPVSHESEEVLGRIGNLVQIKPEAGTKPSDLQRAISWYIQGYLLVYVVKKERKAHELRSQFPDLQFMILEILKTPQNRVNQRPPPGPGNPVYVKDLLWIPMIPNSEGCRDVQKVLTTILGNTILVNTLEDATSYLREFNNTNNYKCPNILTRDGHRLTVLGIIGGASNSAPQNLMYRLGLAPSAELLKIQTQLQMLPQLKAVIGDRILKEREFQDFKNKVDRECENAKASLLQWNEASAEIEKKLKALTEVWQSAVVTDINAPSLNKRQRRF